MGIAWVAAPPSLPPRSKEGHKGNYGRVLIVGGSVGLSGAPVLAAEAALRGGAGLVTVAVPRSVLDAALRQPALMSLPLACDRNGNVLLSSVHEILGANADVLAIGPGLGRHRAAFHLAIRLLEKSDKPIVLDADGLNAIAGRSSVLDNRASATILTPHVAEFSRLSGQSIVDIQLDRVGSARAFAERRRVILVLKGHETVVTDGARAFVNKTGNPGMATAGAGDVLTGLTAALLGQTLDAFTAACLAVHLHGLAGDIAADAGSQPSLIAPDLIESLPAAFARHAGREPL